MFVLSQLLITLNSLCCYKQVDDEIRVMSLNMARNMGRKKAECMVMVHIYLFIVRFFKSFNNYLLTKHDIKSKVNKKFDITTKCVMIPNNFAH